MRHLVRMTAAVLAALAFASLAQAAPGASQLKLVAVFGLNAMGRVDPADKAALEEQLRTEAGQHLAPGGLVVLTGETQLQILDENGLSADDVAKACEQSCPLKVAQELKVRTFIAGSVNRGGDGSMVLFVRAFDGVTGAMISSASVEGNGGRELRRGLTETAAKFFRRVLEHYGLRADGNALSPALPELPPGLRPEGGALGLPAGADALIAYHTAVEADAKGRTAPQTAANAWEALGRITERNPYAADAKKRGEFWRNFEKNFERDTADLRKVLGLATFPQAQKLQLARSYHGAYGEEALFPLLAAVQPVEQAKDLCEMVTGALAGSKRKVEIREESGAPVTGEVEISFDLRRWAPAAGEHNVPACPRFALLRDKRWNAQFTVPVPPHADPVVLVLPRLRPGTEFGTDTKTGLQWTRALSKQSMKLPEAREWCRNLALAGGGWRLPNVADARSLIGVPGLEKFFEQYDYYKWIWTTSRSDTDPRKAHMMGEWHNPYRLEMREDVTRLSQYVRCVRSVPGTVPPKNDAPEAEYKPGD